MGGAGGAEIMKDRMETNNFLSTKVERSFVVFVFVSYREYEYEYNGLIVYIIILCVVLVNSKLTNKDQ